MPASRSTTHLDTPIGTDLRALLKRAAEIRGVTMTDFVVAAAQKAAWRTIAEALLSSPPPPPALKRAFAHRRERLGNE
jgi:uncharacterized protein (DUF1778 family)